MQFISSPVACSVLWHAVCRHYQLPIPSFSHLRVKLFSMLNVRYQPLFVLGSVILTLSAAPLFDWSCLSLSGIFYNLFFSDSLHSAERCCSLVWCIIVTWSSLWTYTWFRSLCFHPLLTASKSFTKSSKSDRMILSTRGPQKETLEETKIYSIVIGPSVSQVAGASPFCRAVKVFLVQGWNKLGLLGILLPASSASFPGRHMLAVPVTWQRTCHSA